MKNESDVRVCKNKKCQKVLPAGYKHRYCEACRNKHVRELPYIADTNGTAGRQQYKA